MPRMKRTPSVSFTSKISVFQSEIGYQTESTGSRGERNHAAKAVHTKVEKTEIIIYQA